MSATAGRRAMGMPRHVRIARRTIAKGSLQELRPDAARHRVRQILPDARLRAPPMKRYLLLVFGMIAVILLLFALVEALDIPLLTDPSESLTRLGGWAALAGVALLVADVVLPVPSSLVMVAHGALFGVTIGPLLALVVSPGS